MNCLKPYLPIIYVLMLNSQNSQANTYDPVENNYEDLVNSIKWNNGCVVNEGVEFCYGLKATKWTWGLYNWALHKDKTDSGVFSLRSGDQISAKSIIDFGPSFDNSTIFDSKDNKSKPPPLYGLGGWKNARIHGIKNTSLDGCITAGPFINLDRAGTAYLDISIGSLLDKNHMRVFVTSDQIKDKLIFDGKPKFSKAETNTFSFDINEPQSNLQIKVCNVRYGWYFLIFHMRLTLVY